MSNLLLTVADRPITVSFMNISLTMCENVSSNDYSVSFPPRRLQSRTGLFI